MNEEKTGYGKRPLWQWVVLYVVVGGALYGLAYYFFLAGKGGYNYGAANTASETQQQSVIISNFAFSPKQISVKVGARVTWTNKDSVAHTVTSNDGFFESGTLNPGGTYSYVFPAPGTYRYHCAIHPSMTAIVVVTQ